MLRRSAARRSDPAVESLGRVPDSDVEALILEIEIAADTYPDLVADHPASPKLEKSVPLRVEQLATEALVVLRAGLDGAVVPVVEACAKATGPEQVGAAHPLGRVIAHPVLAHELLEPGERCLACPDASICLLAIVDPVVLEPQ